MTFRSKEFLFWKIRCLPVSEKIPVLSTTWSALLFFSSRESCEFIRASASSSEKSLRSISLVFCWSGVLGVVWVNFHKNSKYELLGCNWRELRECHVNQLTCVLVSFSLWCLRSLSSISQSTHIIPCQVVRLSFFR